MAGSEHNPKRRTELWVGPTEQVIIHELHESIADDMKSGAPIIMPYLSHRYVLRRIDLLLPL